MPPTTPTVGGIVALSGRVVVASILCVDEEGGPLLESGTETTTANFCRNGKMPRGWEVRRRRPLLLPLGRTEKSVPPSRAVASVAGEGDDAGSSAQTPMTGEYCRCRATNAVVVALPSITFINSYRRETATGTPKFTLVAG
nr:hypothetical protein Iba_contig528CG0010 [Ipomoea batatas]